MRIERAPWEYSKAHHPVCFSCFYYRRQSCLPQTIWFFPVLVPRKYDDAMRNALSEWFAYAIHQWHKGKNKTRTPNSSKAKRARVAFCPKSRPNSPLGKRDATLDERACEMRASANHRLAVRFPRARKGNPRSQQGARRAQGQNRRAER